MVIVSTIALATMVSNHIIVPLWLKMRPQGALVSGDIRYVNVLARRLSIAGILALGYLYFRISAGGAALAAIGLVSFSGAVQVLPALLGAIFWRGATRVGAGMGLVTGFVVWIWTLYIPSFGAEALLTMTVINDGPFGLSWLRPNALFGLEGMDQLVHGLLWSLLLNTLMFFLGSVFSFPRPLERFQGVQFVNVFEMSPDTTTWTNSEARADDLLIMAQRILGGAEAQALFQKAATEQGKEGYLPDVTPDFVLRLERELAGSVGAATAHAMVGQLTQGAAISVEDLIAVADEAAQILEYSNELEAKSAEQDRTARALRDANTKLTAISIQKDAFLSQISHELRTPMTSIRSFSEILREEDVSPVEHAKYAGIIHDEALRLTRLLDDLLDLSVLENGQVTLHVQTGRLRDLLDRAVGAAGGQDGNLRIVRNRDAEDIALTTDLDRLVQVFVNVIANAQKYCTVQDPVLRINLHRLEDGRNVIDFVDNGCGISVENQSMIFEKFARFEDEGQAGGAGLGLAICREILGRLGGEIKYDGQQNGAAFRVTLPGNNADAESLPLLVNP